MTKSSMGLFLLVWIVVPVVSTFSLPISSHIVLTEDILKLIVSKLCHSIYVSLVHSTWLSPVSYSSQGTIPYLGVFSPYLGYTLFRVKMSLFREIYPK